MIKFLVAFILCVVAFQQIQAQSSLPLGSHPPALEYDHFPNRVYAVVWRNWNLVAPARVANALGCSEKDILDLASSMGLPPAMPIPKDYGKKMYITILRRNWHLLPYDQLLELLDLTEDELAFSLKEDDFLFVKLGNLKPACAHLKYKPPDGRERKQARVIRDLVETRLNNWNAPSDEPRYAFIESLKAIPADELPMIADESDGQDLRFIYSYFGVFGDPLLDEEMSSYPDGLLYRLAVQGVNGIWMHVVLNQLVPEGGQYPEFGAGSAERLVNLQKLVARAEKYGIKVYLYMNEPRAMPYGFFKDKAAIAGAKAEGFQAMCTSTDEVLNWLRNSLAHVFRTVPGLGGVFTITASENFTNCVSKGQHYDCPRCSKRDYADIIADVNKAIAEGVHTGSSSAKVIVWDWGWNGHGDGTEIIEKLPDDVWFMSVSEWATPFKRGGVESTVGEYSISVVGPGPRAQRHWQLASERGMQTVAKVQFNNTWELSAVPWLPTMDLIAQHAYNLTRSGVDGYMLSWSLGGYPSPNLEVANRFARDPGLTMGSLLDELARERYGTGAAVYGRKAWTAFSEAFRHFPYGGDVVYRAPQQYGPANLLYRLPTGYAATMIGFPYDDLDGWRGAYSRADLATQFEKVAEGWKDGLSYFDQLLAHIDPEYEELAISDYRIAKAAYLHFASAANQCKYIIIRDALLKGHNGPFKEDAREDMIHILKDEIALAKGLFEIASADSRIGFEASNQYYYVGQDLAEKIINCEFLLKERKFILERRGRQAE